MRGNGTRTRDIDRNRRGVLRNRRGRPDTPRLTCAGCGGTIAATGALGWQSLLGADLAPAVFCPACARPELRRFVAEHRAARSMALASCPA